MRGDLFVGAVHIRPLDAHRAQCAYLVALDPKSGLAGDTDSSTGTWLANKVTSVQPLILADVAKYIAANPHLFAAAGGADAAASGIAAGTAASAAASAPASVSTATTDDERASARAFSAAAHATYAARLAALRPLLEREHAADTGRPFDAPREVRCARAEQNRAKAGQCFCSTKHVQPCSLIFICGRV